MKSHHLFGIAAAAVVLGTMASAQDRLPRECRREIVQLCGVQRDAIRACIREKRDQLSDGCRSAIQQRVMERRGADQAGDRRAGAKRPISGVPPQEFAYGADPLQKLNFFRPLTGAKRVPLIVFVHGGGWKKGDKDNTTGRDFAPHFNGQGYAVASINYRLVPNATVEQQAADIAQSLAWLRTNAARLGFDPGRVVLMGHSAGAHLVALVGTDPTYLRGAGLGFDALRGVIPNDGAAYTVAEQMRDGPKMMQKSYAEAFGADPARHRALSPTLHAAKPNAPAFLLIHVQRPDGVRQAKSLAKALNRAGTPAEVRGFPGEGLKGHMEINRRLGDPAYPATPVVDAWLKRVFGS